MNSGLIANWNSITTSGITQFFINLVDEIRLKYLGILITESWKVIISSYRAVNSILDEKNVDGTNSLDSNFEGKNIYTKAIFNIYNIINTNADANANNASDMGDAGSIDGAKNNVDDKNAHATGFSIYNVIDTNASMNMSDTSVTKDVGGTGDVNNNFDGKNTYAKGNFSIYIIAGLNKNANDLNGIKNVGNTSGTNNKLDNKNAYIKVNFSTYNIVGVGTSNTSDMSEKVDNNINNTSISQ